MASAGRPVLTVVDPLDAWATYWKSFERRLRSEGKSEKTIATYADGAATFRAWAAKKKLDTDPRQITKADIEDFLGDLRQTAAASTVKSRTSTLKRFFGYLVGEDIIKDANNPTAKIKVQRVEEKSPEVLSDEEVAAMLKACGGRSFDDRRDYAIILLVLDTGMRRFEIAAMPLLTDAVLDAREFRFKGKGGQRHEDDVVFLSPKVIDALDRYLRVRAEHPHAKLDKMWLAQRGALSPDGVHHLVRRRAAQAGIKRTFGPHALRHTFAHNLKAAGVGDENLMALGRWRDAKSMFRYGKSTREVRAREALLKNSLADKFGK